MKVITPQISEKTQLQISQNCFIRLDRATYQGSTYDSVPFRTQFDTDQYLFELFGDVSIAWLNQENYEYQEVNSIYITMFDDVGEVFPDEKIYDEILNNLHFSII
jgi:hypothetical protein